MSLFSEQFAEKCSKPSLLLVQRSMTLFRRGSRCCGDAGALREVAMAAIALGGTLVDTVKVSVNLVGASVVGKSVIGVVVVDAVVLIGTGCFDVAILTC